jgi:hypothetical protein
MSFRILEKAETDLSISELELSSGDALGLNSGFKFANSSSIRDKNR